MSVPLAMVPRQALRTVQVVAAATTGGLLVLAALSSWIAVPTRVEALAFPAGLLGIVSPLVGFRLRQMQLDQGSGKGVEAAAGAWVRGHVLAFAVSEAVGLFGVLAYVMSGRIESLIGVLTHVILAGAIWPSEESLERFLGPERP